MTGAEAVLLVISVLLFVYLGYALLRGENL